jgi:hypothetical protein
MTKLSALFFIATLAGCSKDRAPIVRLGDDGGPEQPTGDSAAPAPEVHHVDRAHLKDTGTAPFDYSNPDLWVCLPGNDPNECHDNLDATEFLKDNTTKLDKHEIAKNPPFDCFYVYPTVDLSGDGNLTNFSDIGLILDPLLAQGARFTRLCELYAPLYRQISLSIPSAAPAGDAGADAAPASVARTGDAMLAYKDVEDAFNYYMAHYNKGRKIVLISHSQGTAMLTQLVANKFDKDADLRKQLISALLIGGGITVPQGKDVGGSFQNVPLCTKPAQTGCVIAYNSFAKEAPPPSNSLFGKASTPGMQIACTDPKALAGNTGRYRGSYMPTSFHNAVFKPDAPATVLPMVSTPYTMARDLFNGQCVFENGFSYLEIRPDQTADDTRPVPPYRTTSSETLGFGLHIADFSIEQDDLLDAVDQQAKAALGK